MKKRVNHIWHDDWIINNLMSFSSYKNATDQYRKEFNIDITLPAFKNHCKYKLKIDKPRFSNYRHVTKEQADWLKNIYTKIGSREAQKMWNERYQDNLSISCIKQIAKRFDIAVDPEIATANKIKAAHGANSKRAIRNTGDTRMECGRLVMKDETGNWKSAGRCIWEKHHGKIPDGYAIIALDGDTTNIDLSNLEIIPWKYLGKLQRNGFFSSDPEITKTGIVWCDLDHVLSIERRL